VEEGAAGRRLCSSNDRGGVRGRGEGAEERGCTCGDNSDVDDLEVADDGGGLGEVAADDLEVADDGGGLGEAAADEIEVDVDGGGLEFRKFNT
jgi:hypothetical protein